jgi:aldehyde dehydrogenase (NAD+)
MHDVAIGSKADVEKAVVAACPAFSSYSTTGREDRVALLGRIIESYKGADEQCRREPRARRTS